MAAGSGALRAQPSFEELENGFAQKEQSAARRRRSQSNIDIRSNIGAAAGAQARTSQSVVPMAVLGFVIAAVLVTISMVARIQLLEVSNATAELNSRLSELEQEETRLKIEYENTFNLTDIESYAVNTLGMQKPVSDQIVYMDTAAEDRSVVVPQQSQKSVLQRAWEFITSVGSYLN